MSKIFVAVTAYFDLLGRITPLSIEWEDGRVFEIDRVVQICRAASLKAGGKAYAIPAESEVGKAIYFTRNSDGL